MSEPTPFEPLTAAQLAIGFVMASIGSLIAVLGIAYGLVLFSYPFVHPNTPPQAGADAPACGSHRP